MHSSTKTLVVVVNLNGRVSGWLSSHDTNGRAIDEIIMKKDLVVSALGMAVCMGHTSMDLGCLEYITDCFPVPLVRILRENI